MALVTNGWQRAQFLSITKTVGSNAPVTTDHDIKVNFTANGRTHTAVTTAELAVLTEAEYVQRALDFKAYVLAEYASQYPGLSESAIDCTLARKVAP